MCLDGLQLVCFCTICTFSPHSQLNISLPPSQWMIGRMRGKYSPLDLNEQHPQKHWIIGIFLHCGSSNKADCCIYVAWWSEQAVNMGLIINKRTPIRPTNNPGIIFNSISTSLMCWGCVCMGCLFCFIVAKIGCWQGKNTILGFGGFSSSQDCCQSPAMLSLPPWWVCGSLMVVSANQLNFMHDALL